jgi:hypothetical protein
VYASEDFAFRWKRPGQKRGSRNLSAKEISISQARTASFGSGVPASTFCLVRRPFGSVTGTVPRIKAGSSLLRVSGGRKRAHFPTGLARAGTCARGRARGNRARRRPGPGSLSWIPLHAFHRARARRNKSGSHRRAEKRRLSGNAERIGSAGPPDQPTAALVNCTVTFCAANRI